MPVQARAVIAMLKLWEFIGTNLPDQSHRDLDASQMIALLDGIKISRPLQVEST